MVELSTHRFEPQSCDDRRVRRPSRAALDVPAGPDITFTTISDSVGFNALRPEWVSLFEACGLPHQVFQTYEWLAAWASAYLDSHTRLSIVTGRIDGRLVLVWPLVVRHAFGLRVLSGMGEPLSQYSDALLAADLDVVSLDAAFDHIIALPVDVVSFRRVRDDAAIIPLLQRRAPRPIHRQMSPYVDFAGAPTVEAFEKRFPGKLRSSRRRRRRRLDERGPITFTTHGPSAEAAALISTALAFKREWAHRTGVHAPTLRGPRFEQAFVAAALAGHNAPPLRVSALRCGSDIVGIAMSVACKGRLFGHVLAPRPGFEAYGVGGILAEMTIVSALEQGDSAVDLLAPADAYKLEWTTTWVGVDDYCVPRSIIGQLYAALWLRFGRNALKVLVNRVGPGFAGLSPRVGRRIRSNTIVDNEND